MPILASRRVLIKAAAVGLAGAADMVGPLPGQAQGGFPTRPIKWICFQAAGGSMDLTMRALQPGLAAAGVKTQLAYVEGGAGNIARTQLYTAPPDGYMMVMDANPAEVLGEFVPGAAFKSAAFEPVYGWSIEGYQLCVKKGSPIHNFADLLALSKRRPVRVASIGRRSSSHLQLLILQKSTGIRLDLVHFNGSAQAYPQVIGGNVDAAIGGPASGLLAADQLQFILVFRPGGEPAMPGVPPLKAQGYDVPDVDQVWYTYAAPKTPEPRLARLEAVFAKALRRPDVVAAEGKAGYPVLTLLSRADLRAIRERSYKLVDAYKSDLLSG